MFLKADKQKMFEFHFYCTDKYFNQEIVAETSTDMKGLFCIFVVCSLDSHYLDATGTEEISSSFARLVKQGLSCCFSHSIFSRGLTLFSVRVGRPDLAGIFGGVPRGLTTKVLVCAQAGLAHTASDLAHECGFAYHEEEFAF